VQYILDANSLIDANRDYYGLGRVPEFWDWLIFHGINGEIKIPYEIIEEIKRGRPDNLTQWLKKPEVVSSLILEEEVESGLINQVLVEGYGENLTDIELEQIGRDPFLVAYALNANNRCVVTTENSKPSRIRANKKLPDVCTHFNLTSCNVFQLVEALDFSTNWNKNNSSNKIILK